MSAELVDIALLGCRYDRRCLFFGVEVVLLRAAEYLVELFAVEAHVGQQCRIELGKERVVKFSLILIQSEVEGALFLLVEIYPAHRKRGESALFGDAEFEVTADDDTFPLRIAVCDDRLHEPELVEAGCQCLAGLCAPMARIVVRCAQLVDRYLLYDEFGFHGVRRLPLLRCSAF